MKFAASFRPLCLLLMSGFLISGCAHQDQSNTYSAGGLQQANKVDRAVVKSVRTVDVNDPSLGLGTLAGAAAGGIGGAQIGAGSGNALAILGGVLIGGAIGYAVDQDASSDTAFEYILAKPNGDLLTLAEKQDRPFMPGCHVLILYGVKARVIPDTMDDGTGRAISQPCFAPPSIVSTTTIQTDVEVDERQ